MKLTQKISASMASPVALPRPSVEDVINATLGAEESLQAADNIDAEMKTLSQRRDIGERFLDDKEKEGKLTIAPEEITAEELKAILAFTESLSEGTGAQYSTVMPSAESGYKPQAALESLKSLVSDFTKTIAELLQRLWEMIKDYWTLFETRIGALVNTAEAIIEKAEYQRGKVPTDQKVKLTERRYLTLLRYQNKYPGNFEKLESYYLGLADTSGDLLTNWSGKVLKTGNNVMAALNSIREDNLDKVLAKANTLTESLWEGLGAQYDKGVSLMGGMRVEYRSVDTDPSSDVNKARALQKNQVVIEKEEFQLDGDSLTFKTLTPEEIIEMQKKIISTAEGVFKFLKGNKLTTLESGAKQLIKTLQSQSDDDSKDKIRVLSDYTVAYTRWIKSPTMEISKLFVEVSRSVQGVCNDCLKAY